MGHEVTGCEILNREEGKALVVAGCMSEFVLAFDGVGKKQWATPVGAPVKFLTVWGPDEALVAALQEGTVIVLSPSGEITHRTKLPSLPTALAVVGEKHDLIVVAGEDGVVRGMTIPSR